MTTAPDRISGTMKLQPTRIIRTKRRSVSLEIQADASFVVRAPRWVSSGFISAFIAEKESWLRRRLAEAEDLRRQTERHYAEGETFWFLGTQYPLRLVPAGRALVLDTAFRLPARLADRAAASFERWYRAEARLYLTRAVADMADRHGLSYRSISVTGAKSRWGSCGAGGSLNFTWRLVMAPPFVIEYVVAHEMAHLKVRNHSAAFWWRVGELCPDYESGRRWLRRHGAKLSA
jgi:hypothetical protein